MAHLQSTGSGKYRWHLNDAIGLFMLAPVQNRLDGLRDDLDRLQQHRGIYAIASQIEVRRRIKPEVAGDNVGYRLGLKFPLLPADFLAITRGDFLTV